MIKLHRAILVSGAVGLAAVSAFAFLDQRFRLSSSDGRREYRRVDTSGGVRLVRKLSDAPCIQGRSWGYDRNGVWVDDGCRAEFEVGNYRNDRYNNRDDDRWNDRNNRDWNNDSYRYGYGQNVVRLESDDGRYRSISVDTRGGVELVKKLSDASCTYGRTWGYDRNRIWVDRGCRAIFQIGGGDRYNDNGYDECPSWLPGRYSGYDNGREFILTIDRNGRVGLRRQSNGRWSNDEYGYYRNNAITVGSWMFDVARDRENVSLRSKWDSNRRINLRKL